MRYIALQEPADGWTVFDTGNEKPAEYAGRVLMGLTLREASWFAAAANTRAGWPRAGQSVLMSCRAMPAA